MSPTIRERESTPTRTRIAETALDLFASQGFAQTTIDQIAAAARVGRRTIFRHFATKEAILFDHLVVRRDAAVKLLQARPRTEPALVSLHAVLRELCLRGYDRRALAQIRDVLATNPGLAGQQYAVSLAFESNLYAAIRSRVGEQGTSVEIYALTLMALSWFTAATRTYLQQNKSSLVRCFDGIVASSLGSAARDLAPSLASPAARARRTPRTRRSRGRQA
jgi:AcrR family transcriptional regulator